MGEEVQFDELSGLLHSIRTESVASHASFAAEMATRVKGLLEARPLQMEKAIKKKKIAKSKVRSIASAQSWKRTGNIWNVVKMKEFIKYEMILELGWPNGLFRHRKQI